MESTDRTVIDNISAAFFAAFTSPSVGVADFTELRGLFHPGAVIVKVANGVPDFFTLDTFIAPREELLNSGRLLDFSEEEVSAETQFFGDVAQRWCLYRKSGALDGSEYSGWGQKSMQLVRTQEGWRISAIAWCDAPDGTPLPAK